MNQLDVNIHNSERLLEYWKGRLEQEKELSLKKRHDIVITIDTLAWFLWAIEENK
jgi:hypothetical protein